MDDRSEDTTATYIIDVVSLGSFGGGKGSLPGCPFRVVTCKADEYSTPKEAIIRNSFAGNGSLLFDNLKNEIKNINMFIKHSHRTMNLQVKPGDIQTLLKVKGSKREVESKGAAMNRQYVQLQSVLQYLLGGKCVNAFNGVPPMAVGSPEYVKYHNEIASGKTKKSKGRNGGIEVMKHKTDRSFVKNQLSACEDSASKFSELKNVLVGNTRNRIRPIENKESAKVRNKCIEFNTEMENFTKKFHSFGSSDVRAFWLEHTKVDDAFIALEKGEVELKQHRKALKGWQRMVDVFDHDSLVDGAKDNLDKIEATIAEMKKLWTIRRDVVKVNEQTAQFLWDGLNPEDMEDVSKEMQKMVRKLPRSCRKNPAFKGLNDSVKDFANTVPLIAILVHQSMRDRHWAQTQEIVGTKFILPQDNPDTKVGDMLKLKLHLFASQLEELSDQSTKEAKMEKQLADLRERWAVVEWFTETYGGDDSGNVKLLKITDDDFEMLENDQLTIQGMMGSRYLATFEEEVTTWQKDLAGVADVMVVLSDNQRVWSYLEPLFMKSKEVQEELPEDAARFKGIDKEVKGLLKEAETTRWILKACNKDGLYDLLEGVQDRLSRCKKSLNDFLDAKRRIFPRFYFTSEADLLDILSNGSTPRKIAHHVGKVFLATKSLTMHSPEEMRKNNPSNDVTVNDAKRPFVTDVVTSVGMERFVFDVPFQLENKVEVYMQVVQDAMTSSLTSLLKNSAARYAKLKVNALRTDGRIDWLMERYDIKGNENHVMNGRPAEPAQCAIYTAAMNYVFEVEKALDSDESWKAVEKYGKIQNQDLLDLVLLTRTPVSAEDRGRIMVLITMDAHSRDTIADLVRQKVENKGQFQWSRQLRQSYDAETDTFVIRNFDANFKYAYEYLGNGGRLVITPLTDRIYCTCCQAYTLKLGCAPAGPAGTGKTETTKDLAFALAVCIYVFNCSPEMDYISMGNIFKGLSASGSWGCFDEFNRLRLEVLSVCTVQYKSVLDALRAMDGDKPTRGESIINGEKN